MTVKSTVSTITRFINVSAEIFLSICLNNSGLFALIRRFVGCTDIARRSQGGFLKHACGIITTCSGVADAELNRRSGLGQKSAFSPYHSAVRPVVFVKLILRDCSWYSLYILLPDRQSSAARHGWSSLVLISGEPLHIAIVFSSKGAQLCRCSYRVIWLKIIFVNSCE